MHISTVGKLLLTVNFTCLALDWKELTALASVSWCIPPVGWGEDGNKPGSADVVPTGEAEEGGVRCGSKAGASVWSFPRCRAVPGTCVSLQVWEAESWRTCGTESACLGLMCGVSTLQMAPMPVLW